MNESIVLQCNPFEGDFGESGDRTLSNKMVTTRKECECSWCFATVQKGERVRKQVEIFDGRLEGYCWCNKCCKAMESDMNTGSCDRTEARIELGRKRMAYKEANKQGGAE